MLKKKITFKYFEQAILGIKDNYGIIYYLTLDVLYANCETDESFHILNKLFNIHRGRLTPVKLSAVIGALLEYSIVKSIPGETLSIIYELIEGAISYAEEDDDEEWISKGFCLLKRSCNTQLLLDMLDLPLSPDGLSDKYVKNYFGLIKSLIDIEKRINPFFEEMTVDIKNKYKQRVHSHKQQLTISAIGTQKNELIKKILNCIEKDQNLNNAEPLKLPPVLVKG